MDGFVDPCTGVCRSGCHSFQKETEEATAKRPRAPGCPGPSIGDVGRVVVGSSGSGRRGIGTWHRGDAASVERSCTSTSATERGSSGPFERDSPWKFVQVGRRQFHQEHPVSQARCRARSFWNDLRPSSSHLGQSQGHACVVSGGRNHGESPDQQTSSELLGLGG